MSLRKTNSSLRQLLGVAVCCCAPVFAQAALTPGPDAYGYTVNPTGAFAFTNISGTGVKVLNFDDDAAVTVNLGFSFSFYGTNYSTVSFSENGLMSFGGTNIAYSNVNLTISVPGTNLPTMAVLWCDYDTAFVGSDAVYYKTLGAAGSRQFIVQWNQVELVPGAGVDTVTFQARLFEGSNRILFSYLDVVVADDPTYSNGAYATVGIRGVDGQLNGRNLLWSHEQAAVTNGMHLLFVPPDRPPVAVNDSAATAKNTPVSIPVLVNDTDPEGDPLTIVGVSPTNGTATIAGTNVVFSPATNFWGSALLGYTISDGLGGTASALITVSVTNRSPVVANDSAGTDEDTPVMINVLTNDMDPDGDLLSVIAVAATTHGTVMINTNGTVTYQPATNFNGLGGLTYTISDGYGGAATGAVSVTIWPVNDPPVLTAIGDRVINEGELLTFSNSATDLEAPPEMLTFGLSNAPPGASINPTNGVLTWTPSEAQGPGTNVVTVVVTDNGSPNLSSAKAFTVVVNEVNLPPVLAMIADRTISPGDMLIITNSATDPDIPANALTFSLDPDVPEGASINATNGMLIWTPIDAQGNTTNTITVRVTDDGVPPLSDTRSFSVRVTPLRPRIQSLNVSSNQVTVIWTALPGVTYRLQYTTNLVENKWDDLLPDVVAISSTATNSEFLGAEEQRYYRVNMVLP
jgi:hypothetical protein